MDTIRVSCVQFQPKMGDVEWNLNTIAGYFEQGSITGSQVLVFPELIVQGYLPQIIESTAELVSGHACQLLTELSRKYGIYAVVGMAERNNGKIFNSAILFGPEGKIIGVYRKVHLWSTETVYFAHGSEYPVFDTDFGKMGMWICYDTRFPEVARSYAIQGARIAFISTAWLARDIEHWKLAVSSRAMDNFIFVCGADEIFEMDFHQSHGASIIVNPDGQIIASAEIMKEGLITADIDLRRGDELRELIPVLRDRQPQTYHVLCQ